MAMTKPISDSELDEMERAIAPPGMEGNHLMPDDERRLIAEIRCWRHALAEAKKERYDEEKWDTFTKLIPI